MSATPGEVLKLFAKRAGILNGVVAWTVFWAVIVRLHLQMGDTIAALITAGITVLPTAGLLLWVGTEVFFGSADTQWTPQTVRNA